MALFIPGVAVSQISGRVGGSIFSHNRGGQYIRNGTKPKVVTSDAAVLQKSIVSQLSRLWATLTTAQRHAWRQYAVENPVSNRLGQSKTLAASQVFLGLNARIVRSYGLPIDVPPTDAPPSPLTTFIAAADASDHSLELTFAATPVPANTAYWIWGCVVNSPSVEYYQNRLVLVDVLAAAVGTGEDIGTTWENRFGTLLEGQTLKLEAQAVDVLTGLTSGRVVTSATVAA